jgi:hypothetical protein
VTMMLVTPVLVEILFAAGFDVHPQGPTEMYAGLPRDVLSSPGYIWIEEITGTTPHIRYSDRPSVQLVSYSSDGPFQSTQILLDAQQALLVAQGQPYPSGGIHRLLSLVRPYYQPLQGLPVGVGRSVAQYEFIMSSREKWTP